jgi:lipoyl(octanoyl) transferase
MQFSQSNQFEVLDLGQLNYADAGRLMQRRVEEVASAAAPDTLFLCEFEPVVTVGRAADAQAYQHLTVPVHAVSRGGKATFHGPGQLVAYPILRLQEQCRDLHAYLHALEEALILTVADFDLTGSRDPRNTGCWVQGRKIASIGVAVKRWVTYHGIALNVETELEWFQRFDPCGLTPDTMTTMKMELGHAPPMQGVKDSLSAHLQRILRDGR